MGEGPLSATITLTYGEQSENHKGMQINGSGLAEEGLTKADLEATKQALEKEGLVCELVDLNEAYESPYEACVLVIREGVNYLLKETGKDANHLTAEQVALDWDTKAFMYGGVKNKKARHNLCYSDYSQEPDYEQKKGRVVAFDDIPLTKCLRDNFPKILGEKASNLEAEGNLYYDINKCGIGFHGDSERKIVIAVRLGATLPLDYQWFHEGEPVGDRVELVINHGDVYIMNEKATGYDWRKKKIPTLRHAAGAKSYRTIKKKAKKKPTTVEKKKIKIKIPLKKKNE